MTIDAVPARGLKQLDNWICVGKGKGGEEGEEGRERERKGETAEE